MEKMFVIEYTVGDDCTWSADKVLVVPGEDAETVTLQIMIALEKYHEDKNLRCLEENTVYNSGVRGLHAFDVKGYHEKMAALRNKYPNMIIVNDHDLIDLADLPVDEIDSIEVTELTEWAYMKSEGTKVK